MVTLKNILVSANRLISFYNSLTASELNDLFGVRFKRINDEDGKRMKSEKLSLNKVILWDMIVKSMKTQKTKLKIEQFIPVDENGNLIKDLQKTDVFFKGFTTEITEHKIIFKIHNGDQKYWITYLKDEGRFQHYKRIEDLVPLGIEITELYLKMITR